MPEKLFLTGLLSFVLSFVSTHFVERTPKGCLSMGKYIVGIWVLLNILTMVISAFWWIWS